MTTADIRRRLERKGAREQLAALEEIAARVADAIGTVEQVMQEPEQDSDEGMSADARERLSRQIQELADLQDKLRARMSSGKADRRTEHKSGSARERLQEALDEVEALQREDRPDVDMLTDLRNEVHGIARRETDDNLVEAAERLLEAIDELIARAETADGMRDGAANDKAASKGGRDGAHKLYA